MKRFAASAALIGALLFSGCEMGSTVTSKVGNMVKGDSARVAEERDASLTSSSLNDKFQNLIPDGVSLEVAWAVPLKGEKVKAVYIPKRKLNVPHLLVLTEGGQLIAIHRDTGKALWWHELGGMPSGDPVMTSESVYVVLKNHLVRIDRYKGDGIWKIKLDFPCNGDFDIFENEQGTRHFIMGGLNRTVYGFQLDKEIWPPAYGAGNLTRDDLRSERAILSLMWSFATDGIIDGKITYQDGYVYFADGSRNIYCVDTQRISLKHPREVWHKYSRGPNMGGVIVGGEYAVLGSMDLNIYCLSRRNGGEYWKKETGYTISNTPVFVADPNSKQVAVLGRCDKGASINGPSLCLRVRDGEEMWNRPQAGKSVGLLINPERPLDERAECVLQYNDGSMESVQFTTGKTMWTLPAGFGGISAENSHESAVYTTTPDCGTVMCIRRP